jgi:hypothetical protein
VRASLIFLGLAAALALVGLALEGNWPKFVRVAAASVIYLGIVGTWWGRSTRAPSPIPRWPFCLAGAAAGLVSGLLQPTVTLRLVVVQVAAAVLLIGTVHWAAVRWVPRVRAWLTS